MDKWDKARLEAARALLAPCRACPRRCGVNRPAGDLVVEGGVARRGLLVRHLVMPGGADETRAILDFLADEIDPGTVVNVMGQYRPEYHAGRDPVVNRHPTAEEIADARAYARKRGLRLCE